MPIRPINIIIGCGKNIVNQGFAHEVRDCKKRYFVL